MNAHSLLVLEFGRIIGLLAARTASPPGKVLALALRPADDTATVQLRLARTAELQRLAMAGGGLPPVGGNRDLAPLLRQLQAEGNWLEPEALLEILGCCETTGNCRRFFTTLEELPNCCELASGLTPLPQLVGVLRESISPRGEVLDSASLQLTDIRVELRRCRAQIRQTLEQMLASEKLAGAFQELLITERSGRYVLPVRADRKSLVKGFVHDESASGQTLYIEPTAVLALNNRLRSLLREEQREIERVLVRLSRQVHAVEAELQQNQQILSQLDLLNAAVRLATETGGRVPQLVAEPLVDLRGARHPLLYFDSSGDRREVTVVPIDLRLDPEQRILVISGPNTGGKSVALKTAGLLHLMVAAGLPIPCAEGSRLHLFREVLADIGDEQSIAESQSTFSGHLRNLQSILEAADAESLVLLDELGTGTDPAEGGALGVAVLDALAASGARTVATTHLSRIKSIAQLREGVVNAAVEFDPETMLPSYRLHYGIPGASGALTIARKLGLPAAVLDRAEQLLDPAEQLGGRLLEELTRLQRQAAEQLALASSAREEAQRERERRSRLLHDFEQQRVALLEKGRRRAELLVKQTEAQLREILAAAREQGASVAEQAELTRQLREVGRDLPDPMAPIPLRGKGGRISEGEIVLHQRLGVDGVVIRISGQIFELELAGKRLRCRREDLVPHHPRRFQRSARPPKVVSRVETGEFQSKLLLVGQRVDEAVGNLERFLDAALLHHLKQVEVVHGSGEGVLRRAVREVLRGHRGVSAFHGADLSRGGENVTIVELAG